MTRKVERLSDDARQKILELRAQGMSDADLANRFHTSRGCIQRILLKARRQTQENGIGGVRCSRQLRD